MVAVRQLQVIKAIQILFFVLNSPRSIFIWKTHEVLHKELFSLSGDRLCHSENIQINCRNEESLK